MPGEASDRPGGASAPSGHEPLPGEARQVFQDEGHPYEPEPIRVREGPGRFMAQIIFALLGIAVFAALVSVWRDGTTFTDDDMARLALIGALVVILLVELMLLRPIYDALFRRIPAGLPLKPDEDNYIVGCPGCGTVFSVTEDSVRQGEFACHNCGRPGVIKDHNLQSSTIRQEVCATCGNRYFEYREHSECPVCHTYNAY